MRVFGHRIIGLPMIITFASTIIFLVIVFGQVGIEINQNMTIAIVGFALISGGFVSLWRKGKLHQGHFPIIVGLIFMIVGIVVAVGAFTIPYKNQQGVYIIIEKLWDLSPQEVGVFILLGLVGFLLFIFGMKQMFRAGYFWGTKR